MADNLPLVLAEATLQTLYMVMAAGVISAGAGLPLGVFLATSSQGRLVCSSKIEQAPGNHFEFGGIHPLSSRWP